MTQNVKQSAISQTETLYSTLRETKLQICRTDMLVTEKNIAVKHTAINNSKQPMGCEAQLERSYIYLC